MTHARLRPIQRMRLRADFNRPRHEGRTYHCPGFLLRLLPRRLEGPAAAMPRLGVIASKRVGKAHERNRAKRLLREAFRLEQAAFPQAHDVLLIARKPMCQANIVQARAWLGHLLKRDQQRSKQQKTDEFTR